MIAKLRTAEMWILGYSHIMVFEARGTNEVDKGEKCRNKGQEDQGQN